MHCMACGGEMILMKIIQDVTMPIPGFQASRPLHVFTVS